jgi:hypothetical protein
MVFYQFFYQVSSFLLYRNCNRLHEFEEIEISSKAVKVTVINKVEKEKSSDFCLDFGLGTQLIFGNCYLGYTTVDLFKQDFWTRKLKYSFLVMVYSALFNNVFEALNLIKKSAAETQLPGNVIRLLSIPKSSIRNLLAIGEFQHII